MTNNFKKLWLGRVFSNLGDSLYSLTISWYLIQSTHNIFWIGILNALVYLPTLFEFAMGHVIDRHNKKHILVFLEFGQAIGTTLLFVLMLLRLDIPLLMCLSAFLCSLFGMYTYTTQDAFFPLLVPKEDIDKAQSYMIMAYQMTDYLFNGLIGIALKIVNPLFLILTAIGSFCASAGIFKSISIVEDSAPDSSETSLDLFEGFKLMVKFKMPLCLMIGETIGNIMFAGLSIYIVKLAESWDSPVFLGFFGVCSSIGVVIGSALITHKYLDQYSRSSKMAFGATLYGASMFLASYLTHNQLSLLLMIATASIFLGFTHTLHNPLVLEFVPEQYLGRVLSAKSTISVGIMPLASLFWGSLANSIDTNIFFILFGIAYILIATLYYILFPRIRRYSL